jgi:hypothetical protein
VNAEPTGLLLCLQALHGVANVCWMAGQIWLWRAAAGVPWLGRLDRRAVSAATSLAATLALFSGAGLLAL